MVPNIRQGVGEALAHDQDLAGRPLIPEEKAWLEQGLANTDRLDRENQATEYVVPTATFDRAWHLYQGEREIRILWLGAAHTAGDIVMWLPRERVIATGDVVTAPVPLMPSPYAGDYPEDFKTMKRETARFYYARILPRIHTHAATMRSGAANLQSLDAALFDS